MAFSDIVGTDAAKPMIVTWMVVFVIAFQSGPGTMFLLRCPRSSPTFHWCCSVYKYCLRSLVLPRS